MTGLRQLGNADEYWREYEYMEYCDDVRDSEVAEEGSTGAAAGLNALAQTIESEIVPRLMMAHRADLEPADSGVREAIEPSQADVVDFADTVVSGDMKAALGRIEDLRRRGVTLESIYVDLMAPAARHLGVLWLEDRCDFVTVTLGLSRMQQLLSALGTASGPERLTPDRSSKALLTTIPGDQHTFGLYMVAEFVRRSGWDVWGGVPEGPSSVVQFVRDDWFDGLGQVGKAALQANRQADDVEPIVAHELDDGIRAFRHAAPNVPAAATEELGYHIEAEGMLIARYRRQQRLGTLEGRCSFRPGGGPQGTEQLLHARQT